MRSLLRLLAIGVLALAVSGLVACGGDDEPEGSGGVTSRTQSETPASGGDTGGGDAKAPSGGGPSNGPAYGGDVEQARAGAESVADVYEGFGEAVEAGIAETNVPARDTLESAGGNESLTKVCDLMSEEAQRQTVVYAKRSAGLADVKWNCEKATGLLLRRAKQGGALKKSLRAEVVGVNTDGDRATASIRFGRKGPISTVPLVKEDGEWKLAASPSGGGQ